MTRMMILFLVCVVSAGRAWGVEPWADPELPVTEGMELWLDASVQDQARLAAWQPPLVHNQPLGVWFDGSGRGRHAVQNLREARPTFLRYGEVATARFDGEADHVAVSAPLTESKEATVFILAAPKGNAGGFRALFSAAQFQRNDYTTGLNLDMGPYPSPAFEVINAEGAGFGGFKNMTQGALAFGQFHVVSLTAHAEKSVMVHLDANPVGHRERTPGPVRLETMVVGARVYGPDGESPFLQGFFEGDISEVIVYRRAMKNPERKQVEAYLLQKKARLEQAIAATQAGFLIEPVKDAPPVQVLVPGFTVKPLPVELTNINNLKYRHDGKLMALGYNGNVWMLSDTDGDGLEDRADLFWENDGTIAGPIGMDVTPKGYARGQGVFFASKTGIFLVADTDGDDKADKKITVAEGWTPTTHGVDALGVAVDRDGYVYFGLGSASFPAPYMVDEKTGQARYDIKGERSTILKVSPDFSSRQIVATGIRFPVAIAINQHGDVFCTDQEGATWVPNGNPFDELLHIQKGRHYGFPARHPKHLPNVIDEPSTFDYRPQHQSTCGLHFNLGVNGGPVFGPAWWAGDAIVSGESRGKIYRTQLVKTEAGYVAQNQIIANLGMLTIDAAPTPEGHLVVACHSGAPDWGTGPLGAGKLYKIFYSDPQHPQPVLTWAAGPTELRVAFDRPLDLQHLAELSRNVSLTYGSGVKAGDRFETVWPGYAILVQQRSTPRFHLPVRSVNVTPDRRTLILTTAAHPRAADYALTLPGMGRPTTFSAGELPQHAAIDLDYTISGVSAEWADEQSLVQWSGWLPHPDLQVARGLTRGSLEHEQLWPLLEKPGSLKLAGRINLKDMLRPAVQPGSKLDFTWPEEAVTVTFRSDSALQLRAGGEINLTDEARSHRVTWSAGKNLVDPLDYELRLQTGAGPATIHIAFHTHEDERPRPLPLHRFQPPWTPTGEAQPALAKRHIPQLEGGDWLRGREVFASEQALCSKCHAFKGHGGRIGPDLGNLIHRDYASVLRDIEQPSAALNPDHLAYSYTLKDGRSLVGVPHTLPDGRIAIGDASGQETVVTKEQVASMQPLPVSIMPPSISVALGPEKFKDLLTYLMTEPLEPAPLDGKPPPLPRKYAEVDPILQAGEKPLPAALKPFCIVLAAGPKDHGPGEHDYPLWKERWARLLSLAEGVTVETAEEMPSAEQFARADVVVFYQFGNWDSQRAAAIDAFQERGGGLVYIHWAVAGRERAEDFAKRIGLAAGLIKFRHGPLDLTFTDHPITRGFKTVHFHDESYWLLKGDPKAVNVLATGVEDGQAWPLLWTHEKGKGRTFVSIPGHFTWTFDDPLFRILVLRGIAWSARQPTDRLTELATIGARVEE